MLVGASGASAEIPASLKSSCALQNAHPGYSFQLCTDGTPPVAGRTPNIGGVSAVRVPAKYDGYAGLPAKSADAASMPGADPGGFIALDVDISRPTTPAPPGGYPLLVFMHGCCAGSKFDWERNGFDATGEHWHYNNAWFASRGYVVVNYTARGFHGGPSGSTGETQLDSRLFEINDFQYLAGLIADDPFFQVDPQKVVPTGGSYGGGFAWLALTDPKWKSPGGLDLKLGASVPRYGRADITYSLLPNGHHSKDPDKLPAFDGSDTLDPLGMPKISWVSVLFGSGFIGTTFPQYIVDSYTCTQFPYPLDAVPACQGTLQSTL